MSFKVKTTRRIKTSAVIFADGSAEMRDAGNRLHGQIACLNIFDDVSFFDTAKLSSASIRFESDLSKIRTLAPYPKYFRAVKPWLVMHQMFEAKQKYDLVFYIDAGCEVTNNFASRLFLRKLIKKAYIGGGLAEETPYLESQFTKVSLLNFFENSSLIESKGHIQSTWFMLRNCSKSREFLNRWIELSDPSLNFWQDPSVSETFEQTSIFQAHRHDQSIFSVLYKEFGLPTRKIFWEFQGKFGKIRGISIPIHGLRNRTGISTLAKYHASDFLGILSLFINQSAAILRKVLNIPK